MLSIKENEPLKNHSTFRIGGPAKYFVMAKSADEVREAIDWAKEKSVNYKVIGGGSNILASDEGFEGLIIKLLGMEIEIKTPPDLPFRKGEEVNVECFAGVPLSKAMNDSVSRGLLGLEWAIGIPGTIGGAVHNNAGAYGGETGQSVESVKVLSGDEIKEMNQEDCRFGYRTSRFKTDENRDIILSVKLNLKKASEEEIAEAKRRMAKIMEERNSKAAEGGSAGSTFGNIVLSAEEIKKFKEKFPEFPDQFVEYRKIPAAWLIEECGLKGRKIGGAIVSENHAGKIANIGNATAENVIILISIIKQKVRTKYGMQLMEEIEYIGF